MVIKKLLESPTFKSERRREEVAILLKESCKGFTIVRNEKMKCTVSKLIYLADSPTGRKEMQ